MRGIYAISKKKKKQCDSACKKDMIVTRSLHERNVSS